jgi:hypothetical protein
MHDLLEWLLFDRYNVQRSKGLQHGQERNEQQGSAHEIPAGPFGGCLLERTRILPQWRLEHDVETRIMKSDRDDIAERDEARDQPRARGRETPADDDVDEQQGADSLASPN